MEHAFAVDIAGERWFVRESRSMPIADDGGPAVCTIDDDTHEILIWEFASEADKKLYLSSALSTCWRDRSTVLGAPLRPREDWMHDAHLYRRTPIV